MVVEREDIDLGSVRFQLFEVFKDGSVIERLALGGELLVLEELFMVADEFD